MVKNNNNNNNNNSYSFSYSFRIAKYITQFSLLSFFLLLFLINSNNTTVFAQQSDSQLEDEITNIVVAGDFYCNDETEDTIENIVSINPELTFIKKSYKKH
jgi:hypothetical protein